MSLPPSAGRPEGNGAPEGEGGSSSGRGARHEEEVGELLRGLPEPAARPHFRAGLRRAFLAGAFLSGEARESGSRPAAQARSSPSVTTDPEELLAEVAPPPPARARFRDELRQRFVAAAAVRAPAGDARPRRTQAPRVAREALATRRPASRRVRPILLGVVGVAALAAAVLLVLRLVGFFAPQAQPPAPPLWRVASVTGEGPVRVDGSDVDPSDTQALALLLERATKLETLEREVALSAGPNEPRADLFLRRGSALQLAGWAPQEGGPQRLELERGEIFLRTNQPALPVPFHVSTPQAEVRITGTTLGVYASGSYTCVCVLEGRVDVDPRDERWQQLSVPARTKQVVFAVGGGTPMGMAFPEEPDGHVRALLDFAD